MADGNLYYTTQGALDVQAVGFGGLLGVSIGLSSVTVSPPARDATSVTFNPAPAYTGYSIETVTITDGFVDPSTFIPYALSNQIRFPGPTDDSAGVQANTFFLQWHTSSASVPIVGAWGTFSNPRGLFLHTDLLAFTLDLAVNLKSNVQVNAPVTVQ